MLRTLNLSAAALTLLTFLQWGPVALAAARVSAVCGVAAGDSITVGGSISIICTPRELLNLVHEHQAFRDSQSERIKQIAATLSLSSCEAEELIVAVAQEAPPPGKIAQSLARLARERRAGHDDTVSPLGVANPASIHIQENLIVGIPPEELDALMQHVRDVDERYLKRLEALASDLRFSRCATANFLAILGQNDVPPEQLSEKLTETANAYLKLDAQLRALTTENPKVAELRLRAAAAVAEGDYDTAARVLQEADNTITERTPAISPLLRDRAQVAADRGSLELAQLRYAPAADLFQQAASHSEAAGSALETAQYLDRAGGAYQDAGLYARAQTIFEEALAWGTDHPGQVPGTTAIRILHNIAGLYFAQSDYGNAIEHYGQALQAAQCNETLDENARAELEAACHSGLADSKVSLNEFDSADFHYAQALSLMEVLYGGDHPNLVPILTNLAWLKTNRGEYARAESLYLRAVSINDSRDSAGVLEAAATKNNLAGLYFKLGRYDEAERLWTGVREVYASQLGADHQTTLTASQNVARALIRVGDFAEAERLYNHALAVWEQNARKRKQVEKTHLVIASVHAGLGDLYVKQNRLDDAKTQYEKAISLAESQLGDGEIVKKSLVIAGLQNDRGVVYERLGRFDDAFADLTKARSAIAEALGEDHPDYGTTTSNLARVLLGLGRPQDALPLYISAIAVAERSQRPTIVASRSRKLASVYKDLGNLAEARRLLQTTRRIYEGLGPDYSGYIEGVDRELATVGEAEQARRP